MEISGRDLVSPKRRTAKSLGASQIDPKPTSKIALVGLLTILAGRLGAGREDGGWASCGCGKSGSPWRNECMPSHHRVT